jgi:molecular chaperone IbpA
MNNLNLNPLFRSTVGFDRLYDMLNTEAPQTNSYPPYNIEMLEDNKYVISMAIAGFKEEEIDITSHEGKLTVKGNKKSDDKSDRKFVHRGIAERSFTQTFELADHVEVKSAKLDDGILNIGLIREVPESMKPKKINVNGKASAMENTDDKPEKKLN